MVYEVNRGWVLDPPFRPACLKYAIKMRKIFWIAFLLEWQDSDSQAIRLYKSICSVARESYFIGCFTHSSSRWFLDESRLLAFTTSVGSFSFLRRSVYDRLPSPSTSWVALICTYSMASMSFSRCGDQIDCPYSRWGLTRALYSFLKDSQSRNVNDLRISS